MITNEPYHLSTKPILPNEIGWLSWFKECISKLFNSIFKGAGSKKPVADWAAFERRLASIKIDELSDIASEKYKEIYKAAKAWASLGNFELLGSGSSGSYRIFDDKGASLGVCKIAEEEPFSPKNPRSMQKIKQMIYRMICPGALNFLCKCSSGQGCVAEAGNSLLGRLIRSDLVPETQVGKMGLGAGSEKICSFQLWIQEKHQTAADYLGVTNRYASLLPSENTIPDEDFDELVIGDILFGNYDRHADNWYVVFDEKGGYAGIRLIDGGLSLAPYVPRWFDFLPLKNQYLWKALPCADRPFTEKGKKLIDKLFEKRQETGETIQALYDLQLKKDPENGIRGWRLVERLEALYLCRNMKITDAAKVRTKEEFMGLFSANGYPCVR